jgi:hypothetical protein
MVRIKVSPSTLQVSDDTCEMPPNRLLLSLLFRSDVNRFSYSRSIVPNGLEGADLVNVVLEKTFLMTEEYFPTVLKRSEIVQTEIVIISALDAALADVSQKTKELKVRRSLSLLAEPDQYPTNGFPSSRTLRRWRRSTGFSPRAGTAPSIPIL